MQQAICVRMCAARICHGLLPLTMQAQSEGIYASAECADTCSPHTLSAHMRIVRSCRPATPPALSALLHTKAPPAKPAPPLCRGSARALAAAWPGPWVSLPGFRPCSGRRARGHSTGFRCGWQPARLSVLERLPALKQGLGDSVAPDVALRRPGLVGSAAHGLVLPRRRLPGSAAPKLAPLLCAPGEAAWLAGGSGCAGLPAGAGSGVGHGRRCAAASALGGRGITSGAGIPGAVTLITPAQEPPAH